MLIKKEISLLLIMVIERSYNLIITEHFYFLALDVKGEEEEGNLIDQEELTLILVIIFT
jgi:hypothetical protein